MWIKKCPQIFLFLFFNFLNVGQIFLHFKSAHNNCQTGMSQLLQEQNYSGSDLLFIILIVQQLNFVTFWCKKWWHLAHTHTHTHTPLMSLLTQLLTQSFIRRHYSHCCELFMRLESLELASPANSKSHFHICTLTAKSWHCTYWDGWQLLFISVQQNLFQRRLRATRTWVLRAQCIYKYYFIKFVICGCSLSKF